MGGYAEKLQAKVGAVLKPDEQIVSAIRTMVRGQTMGAAAGGLIGAGIAHRQAKKAHEAQGEGTTAASWPAGNAAVGLTPQRLLVFNYTAMGKPKDLVAEFPLDQVASVEIEKKKLGANALTFTFSDGSAIGVECAKLEKTGDFIEASERPRLRAEQTLIGRAEELANGPNDDRDDRRERPEEHREIRRLGPSPLHRIEPHQASSSIR